MIKVKEILDTSFILKNTKFKTVKEFLDVLNVKEDEIEILKEKTTAEINLKIKEHTSFETILDFLDAAKIAYMEKKILYTLEK